MPKSLSKIVAILCIVLIFSAYLFYHELREAIGLWLLGIIEHTPLKHLLQWAEESYYKKIPVHFWLGYLVYASSMIAMTIGAVHFYFQNRILTLWTIRCIVGLFALCCVGTFLFNLLGITVIERISRETMYLLISPYTVIFIIPAFHLIKQQGKQSS